MQEVALFFFNDGVRPYETENPYAGKKPKWSISGALPERVG